MAEEKKKAKKTEKKEGEKMDCCGNC